MIPRRFLPHAGLVMLLLIFSLTICATPVGQIKGKVVDDKTGDPLSGVSIQIKGTQQGAKSDFNGNYLIPSLPPGTYSIIASAVGYESVEIQDVRVEANQTVSVDFRMKQSVLDMGQITEVREQKKDIEFLEIGTQPDKNQQESKKAPLYTGGDLQAGESGISVDAEGELYSRSAGKMKPMFNYNDVSIPEPVEQSRDKTYVQSDVDHSRIQRKPRVPRHPPYWCPPYRPEYDAMYFQDYGTNPFIDTRYDNLSTFAIDVDDASYVLTRSYLERGTLPPADAIRVEEFVNRFDYDYDAPRRGPFAVYLEGAPSRFGRDSHLLRIGIKGKEISDRQRKPANLDFVIDVSGSMNRENRLELVKRSLYFLVDEMEKHDRIGIVVFNTQGRMVLPMTSVRNRSRIYGAISSLHAGGSTNVDNGLRLGYDMARRNFDEERINRVIMFSDGVANTGTTDPDELLRRIKGYANKGITLSTIGVGMGNYNDVLLEKLGDKGDGNYAYIDDLEEAKRVFVENLVGTLEVIARDVKIQVDFDPEVVRSYRLLGFENRDVADHKFRDNREDGGEIGAGHEVTALYEINLYRECRAGKIGEIFIRFKDADGYEVDEVSSPIMRRVFQRRFDQGTPQFKLAAAAAEFAELLKGTVWSRHSSMSAVYSLTGEIYKEWHSAQVRELMDLVMQADRLGESHARR